MGRKGKRKKRKRKFIKGGATIKIINMPQFFAPSAEDCPIRYRLKREGKNVGKLAKLIIKDKDGKVVRENAVLGLAGDGEFTYNWDGKVESWTEKYVSPAQSPLTVSIAMTNNPKIKDRKKVKVKIKQIALWVDVPPDNKTIINDPECKIASVATVMIKKSDGTGVTTAIPIDIIFTFSDPAPRNTRKADSYKYQTGPDKYLGKRDDPNAIHWKAHPECTTSSPGGDGYKTKCKVKTITLAGNNRGKAKTYFKPSGVGGDDFKPKATVYASDNTTKIATKAINKLKIWRRVEFEAYEMSGHRYVSTHGTTAKMASYYNRSTYVKYFLKATHLIGATYCVKYVGLWDHGSSSQKNWNVWKQKKPAETPTAAEISASNGPAVAARNTARAAIKTKANAWRDRIFNQCKSAFNNWANDAGIPINSIVSIEYEHPKYSANAPNADSVTNEWAGLLWLKINVEGNDVHPDSRWVNGQGFSYQQRAYIIAGMSAARTKVVIAHEAGHETKNQFKRAEFGVGDHSLASGLMDPTGSRVSFTVAEKKILRGIC